MCGICGIVGTVPSQEARTTIMLDTIRHRGPDDFGIWTGNKATLGVSRLAIIDLSASGHQPMSNEDQSIWIAYNGEIYNFLQERDQLKKRGYVFNSQTDTEVILAMYQCYGDDFVKRLRGMFAIAIYDQRAGDGKEKLILVRDQLGVKPLMYAEINGNLIFASELKAMLASDLFERKLDPLALTKLLAYGSIPEPLTAISPIKMLLPAHRLTWEAGQIKIDRYWQFNLTAENELAKLSYPELVRLTRQKLEQTVADQMISDVPLGVFLSGGVDSAALASIAAKNSPHKIKTFSVGFGGEGADLDETNRAQKIADHIKTDHARIVVTGEDVAKQIDVLISALDQPSVDGVNAYLISKAAKTNVTVALSGLGGDEIFAGYPWFVNLLNYQKKNLGRLAHWNYQLIAKLANIHLFDRWSLGVGSRIISKLRGLDSFEHKFVREYQVFGPEGARLILNPEIFQSLPSNNFQLADQLPAGTTIQRTSALILRTYTQNQLLRDADAVSMANSLELRVPFLDSGLVNFVLALPDNTKLKINSSLSPNGTYRQTGAKRILIDVVKDLLPANFDKQTKKGFSIPMSSWLKGPLRAIMDNSLSTESIKKRGFFSPTEVEKLKQRFLSGRLHWSPIWLLMVIELWCRETLDQR
ncbi:asparagine synthase (glutamine-hydrolyzing) [Patescibacteria group bacterium]|nr:asparagine synthase (glutamine-hydrolyzing) [Patescibacteria group bacterium]